MVFASVFMAVLIASLVLVSLSSTLSKRIVRKWNDDGANRPSQRILDIVSAMAPTEKVALFPTLSEMSTNAPRETPELMPVKRSAKVRISA